MDITSNVEGRFLYKYLPFNQNSLQILIDRNFWLGAPDLLNDPFEGDFIIENQNKYHTEEFIRILLKLSKSSRYDEILYDSNIERLLRYEDEFYIRLYDHLNTFIKKSFGTTSFSKNCRSLRMWSHYADSHKGFVIVFDRNKLELAALKDGAKLIGVGYTGLPIVKIEYDENSITFKETKSLLLSKLPEWITEEEVRIVKKHHFESYIPRLMDYVSDSVVGIIYGSRMPIEKARTIMTVIDKIFYDKNNVDIEFFCANKSSMRDSLIFKKINLHR
jgi:hypothetical protein